jgi:hypothetical protein
VVSFDEELIAEVDIELSDFTGKKCFHIIR